MEQSYLLYFLTALYFSNQNSKELEQAEASLQHLINEIEVEREEIEIYNPERWWISSWPHENIQPSSCSNLGWENCVCICSKGYLTFSSNAYAEDCDEKGICLESKKRTIVGEDINDQFPIKIVESPLKLNIEYGDKILITKK